ncbi:MAG: DUF7282 domain-containing protein [Halobacteriota archaeon]
MRRSLHLALTFSVVVTLVAATPTAVVAAGVSEPTHAALETAPAADQSGSPSFVNNTVTVTRGDVAEITVSHSKAARVHVGGPGFGYHLEIVLNGSGTDTITLDTYNSTGPAESHVTGGNATLHTRSLDRPLVPSRYLMNVTVDGVEQDLGTLEIEERSTVTTAVSVAPGTSDLDELDADELAALLTHREHVARGDLAVVRLDGSGLESAFDAEDLSGGPNAEGIRVRFRDTTHRQNRAPRSFVATEETNVTVLTEFEDDAVLLVWDTSDVSLSRGNVTYEVVAELVADHNDLVVEDELLARTNVTVVPPSVTLEATPGFALYPWRGSNLSVTGQTNIAPETPLDLRARSTGPDPFLQRELVTVDGSGSFRARFDFGTVERGTSFPLWVLNYRDESVTTVSLPSQAANLTFRDQRLDDDAVTLRSVSLPMDGFVRIEREDGSTIGQTDHLVAGDHDNVTVSLDTALLSNQTLAAVAHVDRNLDGSFDPRRDPAFAPSGVRVDSEAFVTVSESPRPAPSTTPSSSSTATPTPTATLEPTSARATAYPVVSRTPLAPRTQTRMDFSVLLTILSLFATGLLLARRR